jgi:hypothetical protein
MFSIGSNTEYRLDSTTVHLKSVIKFCRTYLDKHEIVNVVKKVRVHESKRMTTSFSRK